jgi:DNA polymerase III psi subunit
LDITIRELYSETRVHEYGITSNRESLRHGGFNLRWVLTTRQALKGVRAISLVASRCLLYLINSILSNLLFSYVRSQLVLSRNMVRVMEIARGLLSLKKQKN